MSETTKNLMMPGSGRDSNPRRLEYEIEALTILPMLCVSTEEKAHHTIKHLSVVGATACTFKDNATSLLALQPFVALRLIHRLWGVRNSRFSGVGLLSPRSTLED
jgi:hypothetical protein